MKMHQETLAEPGFSNNTPAKFYHQSIQYIIASVWLVNGLFCKILNLVPRHRLIVGRIINTNHAALLTTVIGILEVAMVVWILSNIQKKICLISQIAIIATMNVIEYFLVPNLLLFGKLNAFFALLFISLLVFQLSFFSKKETIQVVYKN